MTKLQNIWHIITNNGVDESALGREVVKVRLLNQLYAVALLVSFINIPTYILIGSWGLVYSSFANLALEFSGVYATYRKKYKIARFLATFLFPTFEAIHVVIHGVNLGNVFTAIGIMAFMLYEEKKRMQFFSILYICILFITSKYYVIKNFDNTFKAHIYSDLLLFPLVLTALALMIMLYQKEIKKYEEQQAELIDSLEEKNEKLSEINKELEQFTYIASHDLKTPLRTIKSYLHLADISLDKSEYDYTKMNLQLAKNGTNQMHNLIRDILEYKTINQTDGNYEIIDLNEIAEAVIREIKPLIESKNGFVFYDKLPEIHARKNDMIVLFQNIIKNGIQYNESQNPNITIITKFENDIFSMEFKDNGIGIEKEFHDKIFQFFKRLHTHTKYEGTGIGLALCKKIVHNYKGEIFVESTINNGSTFIVQFPLAMIIKTHNPQIMETIA
jgi:signal transduction histidine kinase